jgi:hypothetical protein
MTIFPGHPEDNERAARLLLVLETAVPMWAVKVAGWPADRRMREARGAGDVVAHGAGVLFSPPARKPGQTGTGGPALVAITKDQADAGVKAREYRPAEVFNAIAKGLGIGACQPGGVTWLGKHWCTAPHGTCPGVIPAGLLPEPRLSITRLAGDPLTRDFTLQDRDLREIREDLGRRLAAMLPGDVVRASRLTGTERAARLAANTDLIVQHADKAMFDDEEGRVAFRELAEVVAILALQPGGVDFAGRHWCVSHDACEAA